MKKIFSIIEWSAVIALGCLYVIPHWNVRESLNFTDVFVLELFMFLFLDLYRRGKKKFKDNDGSRT